MPSMELYRIALSCPSRKRGMSDGKAESSSTASAPPRLGLRGRLKPPPQGVGSVDPLLVSAANCTILNVRRAIANCENRLHPRPQSLQTHQSQTSFDAVRQQISPDTPSAVIKLAFICWPTVSSHPARETTAGEFGEEAFDRVEPGCGGGGKWNVQRGCRASDWRAFGCLWSLSCRYWRGSLSHWDLLLDVPRKRMNS
jgi:hypothetical protein